MIDSKAPRIVARKFGYNVLLLALVLSAAMSASAQNDRKTETISARAMGTSTQLGQNVDIRVIINQFSTPEDRQVLVDAFKKGQSQGLVAALSKMKPVGRISITGTVGYDLSYIALIPSPTGRKIRFAVELACAITDVPACCAIWPCTSFDVSSATSTSTMLPMATATFSACTDKLSMACVNRL